MDAVDDNYASPRPVYDDDDDDDYCAGPLCVEYWLPSTAVLAFTIVFGLILTTAIIYLYTRLSALEGGKTLLPESAATPLVDAS